MNKRETLEYDKELYELFYGDKDDWFDPNTGEVKDPNAFDKMVNFWNKIKTEKVDKNDFDFSHMVIPSSDSLNQPTIDTLLNGVDEDILIDFHHSCFVGVFHLGNIIFNSRINFEHATFKSSFFVYKCIFDSEVYFNYITIHKKIYLRESKFKSIVGLRSLNSFEGIDLQDVVFAEPLSLENDISSNIINLRKEKEALNNTIDDLRSQIDAIKDKKLSKHYEEQYKSANNSKELNVWKWSAALFLVLTIVLGYYIFICINGIDGIQNLVVRIAIVTPLFVAAIFCANQYTRQKNIAEDYAFKKVLSNSILSFSEHLRSDNPDGYSEYTKILLKRLHQPPQHRSQKSNVRRRDMLQIIQDTLSTVHKNKLDT